MVTDRQPRCRHCNFTAPRTDECWWRCPWKHHDLTCPECGTTNVDGNSMYGGKPGWDEEEEPTCKKT